MTYCSLWNYCRHRVANLNKLIFLLPQSTSKNPDGDLLIFFISKSELSIPGKRASQLLILIGWVSISGSGLPSGAVIIFIRVTAIAKRLKSLKKIKWKVGNGNSWKGFLIQWENKPIKSSQWKLSLWKLHCRNYVHFFLI